MARLFFITACCILFIIGTFADVEYEEHGHDDDHHHHHAHDGHDHHDHESHKNLFTGGEVDGNEDEQRAKLRDIANKIDTDHDGRISHDEVFKYVEQRIKEQQYREADELISLLDPTNTNKITFDSYVRDNYGDLDVNELEKADKSDSRFRETRRTYVGDKEKWSYLDQDGDQSLTYVEFRKFLRPEDDEELRKIEITRIIKEYDDDNDGKISNDEYYTMTEAESGRGQLFDGEPDTNGDGFGDYNEFASYYLPTSLVTTNDETEHLLKECDKDKDGYCSPDEIVNAYSSFAGSQITDFGADLETPKEEL